MAITTKTMSGEIKKPGEADAPEGYRFTKNAEGKLALRKIREPEKEIKPIKRRSKK